MRWTPLILLAGLLVIPASAEATDPASSQTQTVQTTQPISRLTEKETQAVVRRLYREILHREPDPSGLQTYTTALTSQGKDENWLRDMLLNSEERRTLIKRLAEKQAPAALPANILTEEEAQTIIHRLYREILHRGPDLEGLRNFTAALVSQGKDEAWLRETLLNSQERKTVEKRTTQRSITISIMFLLFIALMFMIRHILARCSQAVTGSERGCETPPYPDQHPLGRERQMDKAKLVIHSLLAPFSGRNGVDIFLILIYGIINGLVLLGQSMRNKASRCYLLLLVIGLLGSFILIFQNLGNGSIDLWDESLTAGRSLSVYNNQSVINTNVNGALSIRKPPLIYALNAFAFELFGINEWSLRLANAVFGFGIFVALTWTNYLLLGLKYAALSPYLMMGSYSMLNFTRVAQTDTIFVFGFMLSSCALLVELNNADSKANKALPPLKHAVLYAIGIGLILFGKGPVGFYIILYSIFFLLGFEKKLLKRYIFMSAVASMPLLVWGTFQALESAEFIYVFRQEYFERFNYGSNFLTHSIREPVWYLKNILHWYGATGVLGLLSTVIFFALAVKQKTTQQHPDLSQKSILYITGIIIIYIIIISIASHKFDRYFFPIFPLLIFFYLLAYKTAEQSQYSTLKHNATFVVCFLIAFNLSTSLRFYKFIPDYQPDMKNAALLMHKYKKEGYKIYTDDVLLTLIAHFYLNDVIEKKVLEKIEKDKKVFFVAISKNNYISKNMNLISSKKYGYYFFQIN